jgi:hypothetical protein
MGTQTEDKKVIILPNAGINIDGKQYCQGAIVSVTESDTLWHWATNGDTTGQSGIAEKICRFATDKELKGKEGQKVVLGDKAQELYNSLKKMDRKDLFARANSLGIKNIVKMSNEKIISLILKEYNLEVPSDKKVVEEPVEEDNE